MPTEQKFMRVIKLDICDGNTMRDTEIVSYQSMVETLKLLSALEGVELSREYYDLSDETMAKLKELQMDDEDTLEQIKDLVPTGPDIASTGYSTLESISFFPLRTIMEARKRLGKPSYSFVTL